MLAVALAARLVPRVAVLMRWQLRLWLVGFAGLSPSLTVDLSALVLIQPLHGVTFALLHLACMRILATRVPPELAATAQAIYGTVGIGAATALVTLVSGWLYSGLEGMAFLIMSLMCLTALPVAFTLINTSDPIPAEDAIS
jgi:PPP family 3-phenylpropionic acid transporter